MKKNLILLLFAALCSVASAQEETLFDGKLESGGYGGPSVRLGSMAGEFSLFVGGYGGWLINHRLMIGGGGYGLVNDIKASAATQQAYYPGGRTLYMNVGYGGAMVEYIGLPTRLLHYTVGVLIGAGSVNYRFNRMTDDNWYSEEAKIDNDNYFVLEPSINLELNLTTWMRINAGGTYRFVSGIDHIVGLSDTDLRSFAGQLTLKFGAF